MPIKKVLYIILFSIVFNIASAEENLKSLGKFKDWESFVLVQDENKICFAQSKPLVRAPKKLKRGESRLFVTFRPAEKIKDEISKRGLEIEVKQRCPNKWEQTILLSHTP